MALFRSIYISPNASLSILFKEIRDAYEELSTLERQARSKTITTTTTTVPLPATKFNIEQGKNQC